MTDHTPGPWRASAPYESLDSRNTVFSDVTKTPIVTTMTGANAHLIAAAPDMLKALESLEQIVDAIWKLLWPYIASEDSPDSGDSEKDLLHLMENVLPNVWDHVVKLDAIAKATDQ